MWTLHTANLEHWVPIKTVASFKRMRDFQSQGVEWVVKALQLSEELEVDEAGENVRRRTEVQPPKGQFERSIYAVCVLFNMFLEILRHARRKVLVQKTPVCRRSWRTSSTSTGRPMPYG